MESIWLGGKGEVGYWTVGKLWIFRSYVEIWAAIGVEWVLMNLCSSETVEVGEKWTSCLWCKCQWLFSAAQSCYCCTNWWPSMEGVLDARSSIKLFHPCCLQAEGGGEAGLAQEEMRCLGWAQSMLQGACYPALSDLAFVKRQPCERFCEL